ncbi:MAG TPA: anthranilate phosphoribosyltransferase [Elusimicrobiota bacterium]|nr:anthranilate phosphoribosyltransferase [Elusimicrobiota bacterium]
MPSIIEKLSNAQDITFDEARQFMAAIMSGQMPPASMAAFLIGLKMKGEKPQEIAGCADALGKAGVHIDLPIPVVIDTCGTGGDKTGSFNISTVSALIVAGAGFVVAKHGNRSVSSQCGSADVLEALGVKVDAPPPVVEKCLQQIGLCFMFAPVFHPAMKNAMPVRKELGVRTIFNIIGPLCNPAGANVRVMGVFTPKLLKTLAEVLVALGIQEAFVVHSAGHDELTLSGPSQVCEIKKGKITSKKLTAKDFGMKPVDNTLLSGGDKHFNADIVRRILKGEKGPYRDVSVANAALAILSGCRALGRKDIQDLRGARRLAEEAIDNGNSWKKLEQLVLLTQ